MGASMVNDGSRTEYRRQNMHAVLWGVAWLIVSVFVSIMMHAAANATVSSISTGESHACAVIDLKAKCWGSGSSGQLGNNATADSTTPVEPYARAAWAETIRECHGITIFGSCIGSGWKERVINHANAPLYKASVTKVSAGYNHTCVLANAQAYCWGNNDNGQLGDGSTNDSSVPVKVSNTSSSALANKEVIDISAGYYFTCALSSDGSVACWGRNNQGQLGNDSRDNKSAPVAVSVGAAVPAVPGYCNGRTNGITGCGVPTGVWVNEVPAVPASALYGKKAKKLASVKGQVGTMCAITTESKAVCWGENDLGQVGDGGAAAKSGLGSGSDRANQAHRCSLTKTNAYRNAVNDLPANTRKDTLRPVMVQTGLLFDQLTITGSRHDGALFGMNSNNTSSLSVTSYVYVTAKTEGANKAHYWGGSLTDEATVDCKVNGQVYYGESTKSNASVERVYHSTTSPSAVLYASDLAGPLKNQALALLAGVAYVGSNWAEQKLCTTYEVPWWFSTKTKEACNEPTNALACATPRSNQATAYCDDSMLTCTDNSNGTAFHISMLKMAGTYVQTCAMNGPQPVPSGSDSWLSPGMNLTALDTGSSGFTCATASKDTIGCWGKNDRGQLGVGDKKDRSVPATVRL